MTQIYKWVLKPKDVQQITVPKGTEFLSVAAQHEAPCVWGKVPEVAAAAFPNSAIAPDVSYVIEPRTIAMYGTGHSFRDDLNQQFLGTVLLRGGDLVVHIYEVK